MSRFIATLENGIINEIDANIQAQPDSTIRRLFLGPSCNILEELLSRFINSDGVQIDGYPKVPVLLVSRTVTDEPRNYCSGKCSVGYLTNVRNHSSFVALIPNGVNINSSIIGTTSDFGISKKTLQNGAYWAEDPFLQFLIQGLRPSGINNEDWKKLERVIVSALEEIEDISSQDPEKTHIWDLMKNLYDNTSNSQKDFDTIVAVSGLPNAETDQVGIDSHLTILRRLADYLTTLGLTEGFKSLYEKATDDMRPYLEDFSREIKNKCTTAADFATSPLFYYSLVQAGNFGNPEWWKKLNLEVWCELLDEIKPKKSGVIVECINNCCPPKKGMPAVVLDRPKFIIKEDGAGLPDTITVTRGQKKPPEVLGVIDPKTDPSWESPVLEPHYSPVRYGFDAGKEFKPAFIKILSLNQFDPGLVIGCNAAEKITPPKRRKSGGKIIWETDVYLKGMGTFQVELFHAVDVRIPTDAISEEANSEQEPINAPIHAAGEGKHVFLAETDEESKYIINACNEKIGEFEIHVHLHAEAVQPTGADSEFDRLVKENTTSKTGRGIRIEIPWTRRIYNIEKWLLDECESCYPLVISGDYMDCWRKPEWKKKPVLSKIPYESDVRPTYQSWDPPQEFLAVRKEIQAYIKGSLDESECVLELFNFSKASNDPVFKELIANYLDVYKEWIKRDYDNAILSDLCFVVPKEEGHEVLSLEPEAIIISPLHPVKLSWHCLAHRVLSDAINTRKYCPAASIFNPTSAPDLLNIPLLKPSGQTVYVPFVSVQNNSAYWGVLWNGNRIDQLSAAPPSGLWGDDWGIKIDGLTSGFSSSQVNRAMTEVRDIVSAKSTMTVSLSSDTMGHSSCNEGIFDWCQENLGKGDRKEERDAWYEAGARRLDIIDLRKDQSLMPSPAVLANLTADTDTTVRWFITKDKIPCDLSIIAQLGHLNPDVLKDEIYSPLAWGGLFRTRVRRQMTSNTEGNYFISESRVSYWDKSTKPDDLASSLCQTIHLIESGHGLQDPKDSYAFSPSIKSVIEQTSESRYCALSSSSIDPSCFFGRHGDSFLWDYDLPSYSQTSVDNLGFYLLAKETSSMIAIIKKAIEEFGPTGVELKDTTIREILFEVARRGMPTLKMLASGGVSALGELGMLTTLRLLQDDFVINKQSGCLIPAHQALPNGDVALTMLVPVDPFQPQIDELRRSYHVTSGDNNLRPDILSISVCIDTAQDIKGIKITPIEVKTRTGIMSPGDRKKALNQASSFSTFIKTCICIDPNEAGNRIWSLAFKDLIGSWLTFAFRVYGQLDTSLSSRDWARIHQKTLAALYQEEALNIQVDTRGRLIVIDPSHQSSPGDCDGDGFNETMVIKPIDTHKILANDAKDFISSITSAVGTWELCYDDRSDKGSARSAPEVPDKPKEPEEPKDKDNKTDGLAATGEGNCKALVESPAQERMTSQSNDVGIKFSVGHTIGGFQPEERYYWPSNTALNQLNIGIVGDLGTGKTQLTKALIYNTVKDPSLNRKKRPNYLILDYKKDYCKDDFVNAIGAKVIKPHRLPLNLFDTTSCTNQNTPWVERNKFFADLLSKIYSGIGPVQKLNLRNAIKKSYELAESMGHTAPLLGGILDQYNIETDGRADSPTAILTDMVDLELFEENRGEIVPFSKFFNGVIVIDLSPLGQDDNSKNMLVAIFLNLFYEYMLKIQKQDFLGTDPQLRFIDSMLLVDEADNIMQYDFDVLRKVLLQGREYGVGVMLASQYLSHFKTTNNNYQEMLLTWFLHKVPNISIRELEAIGINNVNNETLRKIRGLECHESLYKTANIDGHFIKGAPFYKLLNQ